MDQQSTETVHRWAAYGKDESFDIEAGMAVIGLDGRPIGTVIEVAGFGSTQLHDPAHRGTPKGMTQAQSGTGYIKVDRTDRGGGVTTYPCSVYHSTALSGSRRNAQLYSTAPSSPNCKLRRAGKRSSPLRCSRPSAADGTVGCRAGDPDGGSRADSGN